MTVEGLIKILQTLPADYEVVSESGDAYGSGYLAWVDNVEVNDKNKIVGLVPTAAVSPPTNSASTMWVANSIRSISPKAVSVSTANVME